MKRYLYRNIRCIDIDIDIDYNDINIYLVGLNEVGCWFVGDGDDVVPCYGGSAVVSVLGRFRPRRFRAGRYNGITGWYDTKPSKDIAALVGVAPRPCTTYRAQSAIVVTGSTSAVTRSIMLRTCYLIITPEYVYQYILTTVLIIEQLFFPDFPLFFSKKNRKYFRPLQILQRAKISGTLSIPIFGGRGKENLEKKEKKRKEKVWTFRTKSPSIRRTVLGTTHNK